MAKLSVRTGKCFLRKSVWIQCTEYDNSWISHRGSWTILPMALRNSGYALDFWLWLTASTRYVFAEGRPLLPTAAPGYRGFWMSKGRPTKPNEWAAEILGVGGGWELWRFPGENNPLDKCLLPSWTASVNKHTLADQACAKYKLLIFSLRHQPHYS